MRIAAKMEGATADDHLRVAERTLSLEEKLSSLTNAHKLEPSRLDIVQSILHLLIEDAKNNQDAGQLALAVKRLKEALNIIQEFPVLTAKYPELKGAIQDISDTEYAAALQHIKQKNYPQAIASFKQIASINPQHKDAHEHLGKLLFAQKNYTDAVVHQEMALALSDKPDAASYYQLAVGYRHLKRFDEALKSLQAAENINGKNDLYSEERLALALARGDTANAVQYYEMLKQNNPDLSINPEIYSLEGIRLFEISNFQESINMLTKAIALDPKNTLFRQQLSHIFYVIGQAFQQTKKIDSAIEFYNKALGLGIEGESGCYAALADIYDTRYFDGTFSTEQKVEYFPKILDWYKKAMEKDPLNAENYFRYGRFIYHADVYNKNDNLPALQKAVELEPNNITYLYGLIMLLRRRELAYDPVLIHFKELGGSLTTDYWEPPNF